MLSILMATLCPPHLLEDSCGRPTSNQKTYMNLLSSSSRRVQLKPLNYKTHSAFPALGIIRTHYFLSHSCSQCLPSQCWRDAMRHIGMCPLSFPLSAHADIAEPCFFFFNHRAWALPFLCAAALERKVHLTANFWGGGTKGNQFPSLRLLKQTLLFPNPLQEKTRKVHGNAHGSRSARCSTSERL